MRIYVSAIEMIKEIARDLWEMGSRYQSATVQDKYVGDDPDYRTIELTGTSYALTNFSDIEDLLDEPEINKEWIRAETEERLNPPPGLQLNPGKAWEKNPKFWKQFIHDGRFSYSYAERWNQQLPRIIEELKLRPNTRQVIMTMYQPSDGENWGGKARVPCSLTYHFMLREDKLVLIYNQRSCDFIKFFASDVYITIKLLLFVADAIGKEPGQFIHFLGSLHAFQKDLKGRNIF